MSNVIQFPAASRRPVVRRADATLRRQLREAHAKTEDTARRAMRMLGEAYAETTELRRALQQVEAENDALRQQLAATA
jgi:hypothetical protein